MVETLSNSENNPDLISSKLTLKMANYRRADLGFKILIVLLICIQEIMTILFMININLGHYNEKDHKWNNGFYWFSIIGLSFIGFMIVLMLFKSLQTIKIYSKGFKQQNAFTIHLLIFMTCLMFSSFVVLTIYLNVIDTQLISKKITG